MVQRFSQPAAYAADVMAQYAGELLFWIMTAALAVYHQLASMKVLPQIAAGGQTGNKSCQALFAPPAVLRLCCACRYPSLAMHTLLCCFFAQEQYGVCHL